MAKRKSTKSRKNNQRGFISLPSVLRKKKPARNKSGKFKSKSFKFFGKQIPKLRVYTLAAVLVFAAVGSYMIFFSHANPHFHTEPIKPFVNKPERGLKWDGLRPGRAGSQCEKLLEVVDKNGQSVGCSHGPDPAPPGVDARQAVEPLVAGDTPQPVSTSSTIPCDGDGQSGYRVQLIYAYEAGTVDNYDKFAASFQQYANAMNNIFVESGQTGNSLRHLRFVQDPTTCAPIVAKTTLSSTGLDTFGNTKYELRNQGFTNAHTRHYIVWGDATVYCGIANEVSTAYGGDIKDPLTNPSKEGGYFGRVDRGCWGGFAEAHELMHTFGGVQLSAPHSNTGYHCTDDYDVMCYLDQTGVVVKPVCNDWAEENRFDCNKDDYFNTGSAIPSTNYLATHWNTADSLYLIKKAFSSIPSPSTSDTILPTVSIVSPANGSTIGSQVTISANATDNVGVRKLEIYIDGVLKSSSTSASISTRWKTTKTSRGIHTIMVKAYDAAGNIGQASVTVNK